MFNILTLKGGLDNVAGFYCDGVNVGMKNSEDGDVAFIRSNTLCDVEAIFTTNTFQAAPLKHFQRYPEGFQTNFVLMNAKNANAMTGEQGIEDIEAVLAKLPIAATNPVMSSTGVIGYRLNQEKITSAFDMFDFSARRSDKAARSIMTTDSFKKEICLRVDVDGKGSFHIAAIAKGAGMINPSMATMLCFITTDADIPKADMKELLHKNVQTSFNAISVDGDTSTNDTVMMLANKLSGVYDKDAYDFALKTIMEHLAMEILRDGEGSNKVVAFEVKGAKDDTQAQIIAKKLSNSLLVKTALFGEDPNWGRIASTVGASGVVCDEETLTIHYDNLLIYAKDKRELDKDTEDKAYKVMKQDSFKIVCDLGLGDGAYTAYGCDLSYEYVKINAEYRT